MCGEVGCPIPIKYECLSSAWKESNGKFFGSVDTFLWTFRPQFGILRATGVGDNFLYFNTKNTFYPKVRWGSTQRKIRIPLALLRRGSDSAGRRPVSVYGSKMISPTATVLVRTTLTRRAPYTLGQSGRTTGFNNVSRFMKWKCGGRV